MHLHICKYREATDKVVKLLKNDGLFIVEVSDFEKMQEMKAWDYIYHEHLFYYTKKSLSHLLETRGMKIVEVQQIETKGGSIRVIARKSSGMSDKKMESNNAGTVELQNIKELKKSYEKWKHSKDEFFHENEGKRLIGYGACATASVTIAQGNEFKTLHCIIDDNKKRQGTFSPNTCIKVKSLDEFVFEKDDVIIVFAWRFVEEISRKIVKYCKSKSYPCPKIVRSIDMREWGLDNE